MRTIRLLDLSTVDLSSIFKLIILVYFIFLFESYLSTVPISDNFCTISNKKNFFLNIEF